MEFKKMETIGKKNMENRKNRGNIISVDLSGVPQKLKRLWEIFEISKQIRNSGNCKDKEFRQPAI